MAEMKAGYKQTDIGVIPEAWDVKPIGQTLKIHHGKSQKEIEVSIGKYPILATGGQIGSTNSYLHSKPSVLIGRKGTIDKPQYIETPFWTVDTLFWSELLGSNSAKFMYYIFCLINWQQYNEASGVPSLNARTIEQVQIPVPKPEEQKQIAAALSDVDGLIESLSQLIAKKRDMKTAAMQQLLTGKKRLPGFDGVWAEKNMAQDSYLKARIGWQGLTTAEYLETGKYLLITGTDFKNGKVDWNNCCYVEQERYDQDKNIQVNIGDILLTKDGTIGKVAYVDQLPEPATLNSGVFVIRPINESYHPLYFYYVLRSKIFKDFLNKLQAGSTINHLYQKDFIHFSFTAPPVPEQKAIAQILYDMDTEIDTLEQRLAKARSLKTGMMQELLTGRTRLIKTNKKQEAA